MKKFRLMYFFIIVSLCFNITVSCTAEPSKPGKKEQPLPDPDPTPDPEPDVVTWYPVAPPKSVARDNAVVLLPASRDYHATNGVPLRVLFNHWVRDPYILNAPDSYFYMVGTAEKSTLPAPIVSSDNSNGWWYNDGIPLWRSKDLVSWETMGYVWTFEKDAIWSKEYKLSPHTQTGDNAPIRAIWAPEIHYLKGNYWIVYSMNYDGLGILKSATGRPEGPYTDINPEGPLPGEIDGSLFEDTDGTVYFLSDGYKIARMKNDMSGLAESPRTLEFNPSPPWAEGITMMKIKDTYVWYGAANSIVTINGKEERTYDCFSATSKSIYGPYENRYRAIPYAGHNDIFKDHEGNWWSTQFHPQPFMNKALEPAVIPVEIDENGIISMKRSYPRPVWKYTTEEPEGDWIIPDYEDDEWLEGRGGFGNPEVQHVGSVSDVGTGWTDTGIWMRKKFHLDNIPNNPHLFLRFDGRIRIWMNGTEIYAGNDALLDYTTLSIPADKMKTGENTIAIYMTKKNRNQYIDVGIIDRKTN